MTKKKPAPKKRKAGRPSLYTEALAAKICRHIDRPICNRRRIDGKETHEPVPMIAHYVCGIPKSLPMRPRWPANGPYDAISKKEAAWTPGNRLTRL